jgi:hypothetical protein
MSVAGLGAIEVAHFGDMAFSRSRGRSPETVGRKNRDAHHAT